MDDEEVLSKKSETTYSMASMDPREILSNAATLGSQEEESNLKKADEVLQVIMEEKLEHVNAEYEYDDIKKLSFLEDSRDESLENTENIENIENIDAMEISYTDSMEENPEMDDQEFNGIESNNSEGLYEDKEQGSLKKESQKSEDHLSEKRDNILIDDFEEIKHEELRSLQNSAQPPEEPKHLNLLPNSNFEEKETKPSNDAKEEPIIESEAKKEKENSKEEATPSIPKTPDTQKQKEEKMEQTSPSNSKSVKEHIETSPVVEEQKEKRNKSSGLSSPSVEQRKAEELEKINEDYRKRFSFATGCKAEGNRLFTNQQIQNALNQYLTGVDALQEQFIMPYYHFNPAFYQNCLVLKRDLKLNAAFMNMKLERYLEAFQHANDVIFIEIIMWEIIWVLGYHANR